MAWHRQGKLIPRESSKSEAVSTKAICTAMHQNEMGKSRAESGRVRVEGERRRKKKVKMSVILCVSEKEMSTQRRVREGMMVKTESECVAVC